MDILPVTNLMQIIKATRHDDQQHKKREQPRKKNISASRSVYTPDGQLEEQRASRIDVVA